MTTVKSLVTTLGVGAVLAAGIMAAGSTPAKADSLRIGDYNGRVGFSLNIGTPTYCAPAYVGPAYVAPVYEQPVYVAPSYYAPYGGGYRHCDRAGYRGRGDWGHDRR